MRNLLVESSAEFLSMNMNSLKRADMLKLSRTEYEGVRLLWQSQVRLLKDQKKFVTFSKVREEVLVWKMERRKILRLRELKIVGKVPLRRVQFRMISEHIVLYDYDVLMIRKKSYRRGDLLNS